MPNPTLSTTGSTAWVNDVNNWRANDAHWLEARSILRWPNAAARAAPYMDDGSISYAVDTGQFLARTTGGVDKAVMLANNLKVVIDSPGIVSLAATGSPVVIQWQSDRVTIGSLSQTAFLRAGPLMLTDRQVRVLNPAESSYTDITRDTDSTGGYLRVNGHFGVTNDTKLNQKLDVLGVSTLASLVVTGAAEVKGTLTASGASSEIVAPTFRGNLIGNVTAITVGVGSTGLNLTGNTLANGLNNVAVSSTAGITLKTTGTMRARVDDGSTFPAQVASVIVQNAPPPAAPNDDYPDGCIWVQV